MKYFHLCKISILLLKECHSRKYILNCWLQNVSHLVQNFRLPWINSIKSLWSSDAIWQHGSRSTLAPEMVCCLMATDHCLNMLKQWLIYHQWGLWTFSWRQFHRNCSRYHSPQNVWKLYFWRYRHISHGPMNQGVSQNSLSKWHIYQPLMSLILVLFLHVDRACVPAQSLL